jgi:hypothetical protein
MLKIFAKRIKELEMAISLRLDKNSPTYKIMEKTLELNKLLYEKFGGK